MTLLVSETGRLDEVFPPQVPTTITLDEISKVAGESLEQVVAELIGAAVLSCLFTRGMQLTVYRRDGGTENLLELPLDKLEDRSDEAVLMRDDLERCPASRFPILRRALKNL